MKKTFLADIVSSSQTFTLNELFIETVMIHELSIQISTLSTTCQLQTQQTSLITQLFESQVLMIIVLIKYTHFVLKHDQISLESHLKQLKYLCLDVKSQLICQFKTLIFKHERYFSLLSVIQIHFYNFCSLMKKQVALGIVELIILSATSALQQLSRNTKPAEILTGCSLNPL